MKMCAWDMCSVYVRKCECLVPQAVVIVSTLFSQRGVQGRNGLSQTRNLYSFERQGSFTVNAHPVLIFPK